MEKNKFRPWSKQEQEDLQHTMLEMQIKELESAQEVARLKEGRKDLDLELESSLAEARKRLKAAKLQVKDMEFDIDNKLTVKRLSFRQVEAEKEVERHRKNRESLQMQLTQGKPILEDKMPEEPIVEPEQKEEEEESSDVVVDEHPESSEDES